MHADTDAIRILATASASHAEELAAVVSALTSLPTDAAASGLGPVGAPFLAAIVDAVAQQAHAVATLGERAAVAARAASASAAAYDDADARAGARVDGV